MNKTHFVSAITSTGVTVTIDAPTEDLVDQTVVVKDGVGKEYAVNAATIKAGATTATFTFTTPLTVSPTSAWTVDGVAYEVENIEIVAVESIDSKNKNLVVEFNSPIESLDASEITIREKVAQTRVGVANVILAKDGMSAQITLVGDDQTAGLTQNVVYTLSITQSGKVIAKDFEIPGVYENTVVTGVNTNNRTISISEKNTATGAYVARAALNIPADLAFDFQEAKGRDLTIWYDKNRKVTKFTYNEETVIYDAIEYVTKTINGAPTLVLKTVTDGNTYELSTSTAIGVHETNGAGIVSTPGTKNNYAKVVLGSDGKAKSIIAHDFANSVLVETIDGNVAKGYGVEANLNEYTILKDGKTIKVSDIKAGDVVTYNVGTKTAEVKVNKVTGKIDGIFSSQFSVNGKLFDTIGNYLNAGKAELLNATALQSLQAGGDVTVYTDRAGKPVYVTGEIGKVVTNTEIGYLTENAIAYKQATRDRLELAYKTTTGETVTALDFALADLKTIKDGKIGNASTAVTYEVGKAFPGAAWKIESFKLGNTAGTATVATEADAETIVAVDANGNIGKVADLTEFAKTSFVDVTKDKDGKVTGLAFDNASYDKETRLNTTVSPLIKLTDSYIDGKSVSASTPVYTISKDGKTLTATTWGQLTGFETISEIEIYFNAKTNVASYLVLDLNKTDAKVEEAKSSAVVSKALYSATDASQISRLEVLENGELKVYTNFKKDVTVAGLIPGQTVDVTVDSKSGQVIALANAAGKLTGAINANTVKTGSFQLQGNTTKTYTFGANTKVYKLDTNGNIDTNASTSDLYALTDANTVEVLTASAGSLEVNAVIIKTNAASALDGNSSATLTSYVNGQLAFTATAGPATESALDKINTVGVTIAKVDETDSTKVKPLKTDGDLAATGLETALSTTPIVALAATEGLSTSTFTNTLNVDLKTKYSATAFGATGLLNKDYVTATGVDTNSNIMAGTYNVYAIVDDLMSDNGDATGVTGSHTPNVIKLTSFEIAPVFKATVDATNKHVLNLANNFGLALGTSAATLLDTGAIDDEKALEAGKFDIVLTEVKTANGSALESDAQITATPAADGTVTFTVSHGAGASGNEISSFKVRIKAKNGLTVTKEATVAAGGTTVTFAE